MSSSNRGIMSDIEWRSPIGRIIVGGCLFILLLVSVIVFFPYFFSFTAGLKTSLEIVRPGLHLLPDKAIWQNYIEAWNRFKMVRIFQNSLLAAGGGVIAQIIVSSLAAYSLSRLNPKGKRIIFASILISMAVPGIAYLIPRYTLIANVPILNIHGINQWWGLWIPYSISPFMILVLKNAFDNLPKEIFDAAQVDGASETRLFLTFALPLTSSLILVLGMIAFVGLWGDFLWPFLILRDASMQTVPVRLYTLTRSFGANLFMASSFIAMIPPTIVAIFLSRSIRGGLTF